MATTTKKELIERIAKENNLKGSHVKNVVQSFLDEIVNEIGKGNRLEFRNFAIFEIKKREARIAQNPKTLEKVHVPARRSVKFKMGLHMEQKLNDNG
jgi:integration host factor subunit beta